MPEPAHEILCFGDSNTWGYDPRTAERYPPEVRWPSVLARELGSSAHVIAEGCSGRTTVWDDPIEGNKSGLRYLVPCLESHKPLDLVVLLLGTNDLKKRFSLSAYDIANGAGRLVDAIGASGSGRGGGAPRVLLLAPPPTGSLTDFAEMFEGAGEKSQKFAHHFRRVAEERGCAFLDAGQAVASSEVDGVHLDPEAHQALGLAVAAKVRSLL
ncbi:MAG: SGNH/GDSL hydrolase family protein [Candidatus Brocadiia bacterium]